MLGWAEVAQLALSAVFLAGVYALIALGFSLVYGVMNILNVAHGSFAMLGAYCAWVLAGAIQMDPVGAAPIAFVVLAILGYVVHSGLIRRLSGSSIFMVFIFTFGLDMLLQFISAARWSPIYRTVPISYRGEVFRLGTLRVPYGSLIVLVAALLTGAGLFYFLRRTRLGLTIQATALDRTGAFVVGINVPRVESVTFALSAGLAGIAGCLYAVNFPIHPFMGRLFIAKAFAIAVLGGLGNPAGSIAAALLLATAEVFAGAYLGSQYSQIVPYLILLVTLVVIPQGLFGKAFFGEVRV